MSKDEGSDLVKEILGPKIMDSVWLKRGKDKHMNRQKEEQGILVEVDAICKSGEVWR